MSIPESNDSVWDTWEQNLKKYDTPFDVERNQPTQQVREGLDELFVSELCDCGELDLLKTS
ncbi:MAG: hypothetical protein CR966_00515 [Pseudomonadales bacterium]|nr:MAG: hypothetical protein CR966_00515 [Pseudomonadales bacterium]